MMWPVLLVAGATLAAAPEVQVRTLAGESSAGRLAAVADGAAVVEAGGQPRSIPLKSLERITFGRPALLGRNAFVIELVDGSTFATANYETNGPTASVELPGGRKEIPQRAIAAVRLLHETPQYAADWQKIRGEKHTADVIVVRKNEALDYLEGVIGDVSADTVKFDAGGTVVPVKREKVYGLLYYQKSGTRRPEPICVVQTTDGSKLSAETLSLADDSLTVKTTAGVEARYPVESLSALDFTLSRIVYLSDLKPLSVKSQDSLLAVSKPNEPIPDATWARYDVANDRNLDGGRLKIGSAEFDRGVALHSRMEVVYDLGGKYSTFTAVAGIDETAGAHGDATIMITGDEKHLFASELSWQDEGRRLELNVAGVKLLRIYVDYGKDGSAAADHVDLCEAKVVK